MDKDFEIANQQMDAMLRGSATPSVLDQLHDLCVALESGSPSVPTMSSQWRRCLQGIMRRDDWRHGTWK